MFEAQDIHFAFKAKVPVLSGISLKMEPGQVIGLSGRSGAGKSTLGRILAGYLQPQRGAVTIDGVKPSSGWSPVQYAHQASIVAVNSRWRIGRIVEEGWQPDDATRVALGISRAWYDRYPHEVSGGELQRIILLRALSPQTRYLVADEVTAMLDPISQAEIWRVLLSFCQSGLGILAISHDAPLLARVASRHACLANGILETEAGKTCAQLRTSAR